jgi:UDP-N-acetylglucosamine diphosphorylase/glucosamine-1-phosphate N-acetyltransferase
MEPFALTRPFGEVRVGALLVRERWERVLGRRAIAFRSAAHLTAFAEFGSPALAKGTLPAGTIVVNSRCAPALGAAPARLRRGQAVTCGGVVAAVSLPRPLRAAALADGSLALESLDASVVGALAGWRLDAAWDLVRFLPEMLAADARALADAIADALGDTPPTDAAVLGAHRIVVERGAYVEPHVVVDTTDGDVVVLRGARLGAFTRIAGPAVIGAGAQVLGGRFRCVAIGEDSRVAGDVSVAIVAGHANKSHEGFVGHSVIGRWANLGAGTTTSNLKNSYGLVRMRDSRGDHDTGMQFLGALVGDHAKTAIGTRLGTGTIIGAGANVFGDRSPDKYVPPFAWGDRPPFARYERDKFLEVAANVMARRDVRVTAALRRSLRAAWEASAHRPAGGQPARGRSAKRQVR